MNGFQDFLPNPMPKLSVLHLDRNSPDHHVPRDSRMIRLTGLHPFNSEAPLNLLRDSGFLTPSNLFYVRNHGSVPEVTDDWILSIEGLVEHPIELSLVEIMNLSQITIPVTLCCAGNRRKEQNLVEKGGGFNWGAAGVSTSLFTGPLLKSVLDLVSPLPNAKYVCMEGKDVLPHGHYGTCVSLKWANDPARKIMLGLKMNGQDLDPDHGFPIRAVLPGVIGGRSVKWLTKLIVTDSPSDNYYHIYDNRVLPTMVDSTMAVDKKWWTDERYAIYDLNVQSVITYPGHDDVLVLNKDSAPQTVSGYAYSGGGNRISRVEISLNKGASWILSDIDYPEDSFREFNGQELYGGKIDLDSENCFAWCFWSVKIDPKLISNAQDIVVRAMDSAMNVQQRDMYWNYLSMLNNCWYRVAIHSKADHKVHFEHPCLPALQKGGWMERVKEQGGNLLGLNWGEHIKGVAETPKLTLKKTKISLVNENLPKRFLSLEQVALHKNHDDCWFIVDGQVYDGTKYLEEHPGGPDAILLYGGADATDDFMAIHSEKALRMLKSFHIGTLDQPSVPKTQSLQKSSSFLNPHTWKKVLLIEKEKVTHDVSVFTFQLEQPEQDFGLPVGKHIFIRAKDHAGQFVVRAYTPISSAILKGKFKLLVKIYHPLPPQFPNGGRMSMVMNDLVPNSDLIEVKGPLGSFEYLGKGSCLWKDRHYDVSRLHLVCGGSGITPIFQVLCTILNDEKDKTTCRLLNGNRTVDDILLYKELLDFSEKYPDRFACQFAVSSAPNDWTGLRGFISKDIMASYFEPRESLLLICGPPPLCQALESAALELGFTRDQIVIF